MKRPGKRSIAGVSAIIITLLILFWPGLPWSARCRHTLKKVITKTEMKVSAWQGEPPRLISLTGEISAANRGPLAGAQVEVLDSVSGWAALSDPAGRFTLRDVIWYPNAEYTLIVEANAYQARQIEVRVPESYPPGGVFELGQLSFDKGCPVDITDLFGRSSISYVVYDGRNAGLYKELFTDLTEGKDTDEEKLEAINRFVASKFVATEPKRAYRLPQEVLDKGSHSRWGLALTMATIAEAGNYRTRMINLIDSASPPFAHMVTEVYYGNGWHLYDPVAGMAFRNKFDRVASYKEIRLDMSLISSEHFSEEWLRIFDHAEDRLTAVYQSGFHHYYHISKER